MFIIVLGTLSDSEKIWSTDFKDSNIKLFNISFQILHLHSDAEEAVSQTFLKIITHIEIYPNYHVLKLRLTVL